MVLSNLKNSIDPLSTLVVYYLGSGMTGLPGCRELGVDYLRSLLLTTPLYLCLSKRVAKKTMISEPLCSLWFNFRSELHENNDFNKQLLIQVSKASSNGLSKQSKTDNDNLTRKDR